MSSWLNGSFLREENSEPSTGWVRHRGGFDPEILNALVSQDRRLQKVLFTKRNCHGGQERVLDLC
jgi:hypothetical protein